MRSKLSQMKPLSFSDAKVLMENGTHIQNQSVLLLNSKNAHFLYYSDRPIIEIQISQRRSSSGYILVLGEQLSAISLTVHL